MFPFPVELHSHRPSRRDLLHLGTGLGAVSALSALKSAGAAAASVVNAQGTSKTIRSCIFVFYYGGPSHLDTYDMKPDAPDSVRGEFSSIATSVPGLRICEHMPHMAPVMHKVALVRSMHHTNRLHDSASTETHTGRQGPQGDREEFGPISQFYPCHGAVLTMLRSSQQLDVPHAMLPWQFHNVVTTPCQGGGFLGHQFDPLLVTGDARHARYESDQLNRPAELTSDRMLQREALLSGLDIDSQLAGHVSPLGVYRQRAHELLRSSVLQNALQIEQEATATRERYGMREPEALPGDGAAAAAPARNLRGQNLLLARRLVEAGVRFVNVHDFRQQGQNWDSHSQNFHQHKRYLLPQADQALAALIEDLDERNLLDSTLVVALGEFGRTPKINGNAGRDHWPDCYTVLLAGGGIRGGSVYGSSDRTGAYPETNPVTPADLAATIYWCFGLAPHSEIRDRAGRPHRLADGRPITDIFA
ncbi:MAG TPA: DUF1501 domain-containing protein [Planctomycetes bacterium]|nr:DUF1501 domain-containing protein [Fuerstiella sp.]HIK92685.1 DUF1501 domain-containing protein [Planctomycetota bacterium]